MKRFLIRVCFVVPMALANLIDDLVMLFTLQYFQVHLGMRFSIWWFNKVRLQY